MASLRAPGLGPIIGHTTDRDCRIWIRAGDPADSGARLDSNRRTIGVIGLLDREKTKVMDAWYFRLRREFDRTGMFRLGYDVALGDHETDIRARRSAQPGKRMPKPAAAKPLQPDTTYTIRLATLTLDDPLPDVEDIADWELRDRLPDIDAIKGELMKLLAKDCEASFRTFPAVAAKPAAPLSFLLGSCRYPGLLWKIKEADRIFRPMLKHVTSGDDPARFVLMVGDQIYADVLNMHVPLLRADTYEEFQERYLTAFGATHLRSLLRSVPNYMILDDHEIEDNWSQDRLHDKHQLFNVAMAAYFNYQWSHGPRSFGKHLHYRFECGGYPFFVIDTRTQRFKDDHEGLRDNHLLGKPQIDPMHKGQLQQLLDWLSEQQNAIGNAPKFIVTSSVFVPNAMDERLDPFQPPPVDALTPTAPFPDTVEKDVYESNRKRREDSDSWPAYPQTRTAILKHIVENKIQNVVFLSGDIHCSNVTELFFEGTQGQGLKAFSVTSSAFYWPFPFADGDPNGYVHDSRQPKQFDPFPVLGTNATMHYVAYGFTQDDNFTRLDIDPKKATIKVACFDIRGEAIRTANPKGKEALANTLQLVPW